MGIAYYPHTSCKKGSYLLGISLFQFMEIVASGDIEIADRGGKYPLVNNDTLYSYISKYGGRRERYNESITFETYLAQEKEIEKYILLISKSGYQKSMLTVHNIEKCDLINEIFIKGYNIKDILGFHEIIKINKQNKKTLGILYSLGLTDIVLEKYYKDKDFDITIGNNFIKPLMVKEKIANVTFSLGIYHEFFKTYKSNLSKFENIDFLDTNEKESIILNANQKFGY